MSGEVRVAVMGGLGNQLFGYFAGAALAAERGASLHVDTTWAAHRDDTGRATIREFDLPVSWSDLHDRTDALSSARLTWDRVLWGASRRSPKVGQLVGRHFTLLVDDDPRCWSLGRRPFIRGYFQSWAVVAAATRAGYPRQPPLRSPSPRYLEWVREATDDRPIIVHVRRGDYAEATSFGLLGRGYYASALERLAALGIDGPVWAFSDEPDLVADVVPTYDRVVMGGLSAPEELSLMAEGRAHIIANSTFSWWGAAMNPREPVVIAPDPWFRDLGDVEGLIPPHWVRVPGWP